MVEVIGEDTSVTHEVSCQGCGARLRFTDNDMFIHRYSACGHSESDHAIKCPRCQKIILNPKRR